MTGGDDAGIIERWKKAADAEPDFRRKTDYAGLARVFAGAANRKTIWTKALEGWNVIESEVVNEWKAEQSATILIAVLESKFGKVPPDVEAAIRNSTDLTKLQTWVTQAAKATTFAEFRTTAGL